MSYSEESENEEVFAVTYKDIHQPHLRMSKRWIPKQVTNPKYPLEVPPTKPATCSVGPTFWIHGGAGERNGSQYISNKLYMFDLKEQVWVDISAIINSKNSSDPCPSMYNHVLFETNSISSNQLTLNLYDGETAYRFSVKQGLEKSYDEDDDFFCSSSITYQSPHPLDLVHHTINAWKGRVYIFGGFYQKQVTNDLLYSNFERNSEDFVANEKLKQKFTPSPRYKHSSVVHDNKLFIFGGIGKEDRILNDLHFYSLTSDEGVWIEVVYEGFVPPPLHSSAMYFRDNILLIDGGFFTNGTMSSRYYKARKIKEDFLKMKWKSVKLNGDLKDTARANHVIHCHGDKSYWIGGTFEEGINNDLIELQGHHHTHPFPVLKHLEKCFTNAIYTDITVKCIYSDGEIVKLRAHKIILYARSEVLRNLILEQLESEEDMCPIGTPMSDMVIQITLDFESKFHNVVKQYISFLYTGSFKVPVNEMDVLLTLSKQFGHTEDIQKITDTSTFLDLTFSEKIHKKLMSDIEEYCYKMVIEENDMEDKIENRLLDTTVILANSRIFCHKLFLVQATLIDLTFKSDMKESSTGEFEISSMGDVAFQQVLNYLYLNQIKVTSEICVELFLSCFHLGLEHLANSCKVFIMSLIDKQNVMQVISIVELYTQSELLSKCISFIAENISEFVDTEAYDQLLPNTKIRIQSVVKNIMRWKKREKENKEKKTKHEENKT